MKLSDRLSQAAAGDHNAQRNYKSTDPLFLVRKKVADELYVRLGARLFDPHKDRGHLETMVAEQIKELVAEFGTPLTGAEREEFVASVLGDVMGLGPIEPYLADPSVTEVMVNSTDSIYVERAGKLEMTATRFVTEEHLRRVIDRIVAGIGRRVDESSPMVDARLPDGSRVNAIIPPLAVDGPSLTIRKFSRDKMNMDQLVNIGALSREVADVLSAAVRGAKTIVVSGGTGTGKTTLLNVLSAAIPIDERIVTIEDAVELQLRQTHVVRLESRPANVEGRGEVTIRDLVRNSLRMRPDRIIVGEVRGPEALDMLQAINTGHDGSLATVHANSPRDALARIETMVLMAGYDLPLRAIRQQVASGVDLIVQLTRFRDGSRKVTQVTEVAGMEGEIISTSDLYTFDLQAGVDATGRVLGTLRATGLRPSFLDELLAQGISVGDPTTLAPPDPKGGPRRRTW
jgi:pilus assembly protein CpaF